MVRGWRTGLTCGAALLLAGTGLAQPPADAPAATAARRDFGRVSFDRHSIILDGKPLVIWSSEFHYYRLPSPSLWRDILQKMKASGFNTVALYFAWGYHSPAPGVYDFSGVRDVDLLLKMAKEEGLYVITRAGPYVNAELSRGGYPGWLVRQNARARTDAPEYLAAADEWLTRINKIIARHQYSDGGGMVILHQIENELLLTNAEQQRYMRHLYDRARADGITVPIFHNDIGRNGRWVPASSPVEGTIKGPSDLYAFDGYPGGSCDVFARPTNGGAAPDWGLYGPGGAKGGASASPDTPGFAAEFGGGWFDYWGSNGTYPCTAIQRGKRYQRVFYGTNLANALTIQSFYMGFGGTSWGWQPAPVVYTSYDYGAAIDEARNLRPKALELKQLGQFVQSFTSLARMDKGPEIKTSSDKVRIRHNVNAETGAHLLFVAHDPSNARSDDAFSFDLETRDGRYRLPQAGTLRLNGFDAKLLIASHDLGAHRLVYSTSELQTQLKGADGDIALLYGRKGEDGETVLRFESAPLVEILEGAAEHAFDPASGDLRLNYRHDGLIRLRVSGGGRPPLMLLIGEEDVAARFWRQDTAGGAILARGPALLRTAALSRGQLSLTGDTREAADLEIWGPRVGRVQLNGRTIGGERTADGHWRSEKPLPEALKIPLPTLLEWRVAAGSPEAQPGFDDSSWLQIGKAGTAATIRPPTGQPAMDMSAHGFHNGDVWYRGRFEGGPDARKIALHYGGGGTGMLQLWLDGRFVGQHELPTGMARPLTHGVAEFTLPPEAQVAGPHVLAVMVRNNGHNWDLEADDAHKEPRGLISVSLSSQSGPSFAVPIAWRIQGNKGGEAIADTVRGPMNNGGQFGERMGWHLPGFADNGWARARLPATQVPPGTTWYRTSFDLGVPKGHDASIGLTIGNPETPRSAVSYRALIFVNGWNMGQFIAHAGPQRTFIVPTGILNPNGRNTLAIAVTSDGASGNGLEQVQLVDLGSVRGGVPMSLVASPAFKPE
ncbi:beta-galactosidase [Sphingomonas parva]|uniref:beta-galactosidase n=1 Tax=Sphingomonas parva TaxID=2555898 RepID=A0A4Y8ZNR3_9SPHN|nr:beta-galactosidase [Sphingomonas parva]TFI57650.1 beta-galactosidase [Sphingomonas parva]